MTKKPVFLAIATCVMLAAGVLSASADADCPSKPQAEEGGTHWCFDAGRQGHVHLWKPGHYDRDRAVAVVYVHGYNLDASYDAVHGDDPGMDGCLNRHYVDCVWRKHRLAKQFDRSGLDALFIAVEGPVNDGEKPKWKSLDALLDAVLHKGGIRPPKEVTAIGHSGGIFTVVRFLGDARLAHVVALDAAYTYAPAKLAAWARASKKRRLTLIGAEGTSTATAALAKKVGCAGGDDLGLPLTADLASARCAAVIDKTVGHMDVIRDGRVLPLALGRTVMPKPKAKPHRQDARPKKERRHAKRHRR